MKSIDDIEKEASSKSINKTITELRRLMKAKRISASGPLRKKLHGLLFRLLQEKAEFWYQRGFRRGHQSAHKKLKTVLLKLRRPMRMYAAFLPKKGKRIVLKSRI